MYNIYMVEDPTERGQEIEATGELPSQTSVLMQVRDEVASILATPDLSEEQKYEIASKSLEQFLDVVDQRMQGIDVLKSNFWTDLAKTMFEVQSELIQLGVEPYMYEDWDRVVAFPFSLYLRGDLSRDQILLRIFVRDVYNQLKDQGLLSENDKELFMAAMPPFGEENLTIPCTYHSAPISNAEKIKLIQKQKDAFESLTERPNGAEIEEAIKTRGNVHYSITREFREDHYSYLSRTT